MSGKKDGVAKPHSLEELLRLFEVNAEEWEVKKWSCKEWLMGFKKNVVVGTDKHGQPVIGSEGDSQALYSVSAEFKAKPQAALLTDHLAAFREKANGYAPLYAPLIRPMQNGSKKLLELSLPDPHFGKGCWESETGFTNYDLKIAQATYESALEGLLKSVAHLEFDEILFVVGNDLLNMDNRENTTTAGTPQSTDTRFQKVYEVVFDVLVRAVERMMPIAPVVVKVVPGNHDEQSAWTLGHSLKSWFRHCVDVTVDNEPTLRKYHRYGNVLLGFWHGNKGKKDNYPLLMATEMRRDWGDVKFCEIHLGHLHQETVKELMGTKVRILPSLCAEDDYHSDNAYVGNVRAAQAFVWDAETGLDLIACHNIIPDYARERMRGYPNRNTSNAKQCYETPSPEHHVTQSV